MIACPNCGGNLKYSITHQQMACEYCNSLFDPYAFDSKQKDAEERKDFEVTIFTCPQCGGEIMSTDDTAAGFCSFCGASTILYSRISQEHRPSYIIPFAKTKEECKQSYANMMKKAIFAPSEMKDPSKIDSFRGIYMPYWNYYLTQNNHIALHGKKEHRRGDYIITDHFSLEGDLNAYYKGLSYDASSSFADNISEAIAPYDVKGMKAFTPAFLSGFYADTADVDKKLYSSDAMSIADANTMNTVEKVFSDYEIESPKGNIFGTKVKEVDYSMFPVWFMSYRNGDRVAYAAVNGQTGKVVTDIPIDSKKYLIGSLIFAIPIFLLLSLFATFTPTTTLILSSIALLATIITYYIESYSINNADLGLNDKGKMAKQKKPTADELAKIQKTKKPVEAIIAVIICLIASVIIIFTDPIYDIFFYGGVIASMIAEFFGLLSVIKMYNLLSTRKLPQFDRTGGDDRA